MNNIKYIIILFFSWLFIITSFAIKPGEFKNISIAQGLSNKSVLSIAQDTFGFIWFGTANGLNRYDGYHFKHFTYDPGNPESIPENEINVLYTDQSGGFWIGTNNGLCKFIPGKQTFERFQHHNHKKNTLSNNTVLDICEDTNHCIWIGTNYGLNQYDPQTRQFTTYYQEAGNPLSLNNDRIQSVFKDSKGRVWIGTPKGINLIMHKEERIVFKRIAMTEQTGFNIFVNDIEEDSSGNLWIGTHGHGVICLNPEKKKIIKSYTVQKTSGNLSSNNIKDLFIDSNNQLWIATQMGGLTIFNFKNKSFTSIQSDFKQKDKYKGDDLNVIFQSSDNTIWLGSAQYGINKYIVRPQNTAHYFQQDHHNSLAHNDIMSFCEVDDDEIWIGMNNGHLDLFNPLQQTFKHFQWPELGSIHCLKKKDQNLWMGTFNGLVKLNLNNFEIKRYLFGNDHVMQDMSNNILSLCFDRHDHFWIGTTFGLYLFDDDNQTLTSFHPARLTKYDKKDYDNIISINEGGRNNLWIASSKYIFEFDLDTRDFKRYRLQPEKTDDFLALINTSKLVGDTLWVGTKKGLFAFDTKNKVSHHYQLKGIGQKINIQSILNDEKGNLWLGTDNNIMKFNISSNHFISFDSWNYFGNTLFNKDACIKTESNDFYFGGKQGFNVFKQGQLLTIPDTAPIYLTGFYICNRPVFFGDNQPVNQPLHVCNTITLDKYESIFTCEYSLLDYRSEVIHYAYKLEDIDEDWHYSGDNNRITFSHIPAGTYTLRVKAAGNHGLWREANSLKIRVLPPFWETLWFQIIIVIILIGSAVLFYFSRIRYMQRWNDKLKALVRERTRHLDMQKQELTKQNEKLKKQEEELEAQKNSLTKLNTTKDKLFSIIAHDLKNPFYGISNFASLLSRRFDKYSHDQKLEIINLMKNASDNANELLENLLQWSRLNTNRVKFHPEQINLMSIVNSNIKFFDILAKNKDISMHTSGKDVMAYADYDMVNTIIRNLVNNAIKFSHSNGNVQLNVEEDTQHAIVKVIDDGIGMDEQTRDKIFNLNMHVANTGTSGEVGTGLGLVLCKEFIEQNNGTIHVESEIGKGTTFILKLPKA